MKELDIYDGCGLVQFDLLNKTKQLVNFRIKEINGLKCCIAPFDFKKYTDLKIKNRH